MARSADPIDTQGVIDAATCGGIRRVELKFTGRGPQDNHAPLIGDLLVVVSRAFTAPSPPSPSRVGIGVPDDQRS